MKLSRLIAVGLMTLILSVFLPTTAASAGGTQYPCGTGLKCTVEDTGDLVIRVTNELTGLVITVVLGVDDFVFELKENLEVFIPALLQQIADIVRGFVGTDLNTLILAVLDRVTAFILAIKENIEGLLPLELCVSGVLVTLKGVRVGEPVCVTLGPAA